MPRGKKAAVSRNALEQFAWEIGSQLGDALTRAIAEGVAEAFKASRAAEGGRPTKATAPKAAKASKSHAGSGAVCLVPDCGRDAAARGLCATHYTKARRLNFDTKSLSHAQLATLGEDGRKKK